MMLLNKRFAFQFLVFLFSVGYLLTAVNLGMPLYNNRLEPSFFPLLVGFFAVIFSTVLLFKEIVLIKQKTKLSQSRKEEKMMSNKTEYAPLLIILSIFVYILAFSIAGYFISSFLFVLSIIVIFSSLEKIIQKLLISITIVFVGYLLFEQIFGVRLPALWG